MTQTARLILSREIDTFLDNIGQQKSMLLITLSMTGSGCVFETQLLALYRVEVQKSISSPRTKEESERRPLVGWQKLSLTSNSEVGPAVSQSRLRGQTFLSGRGATGKSGEPTGWKACPTMIGAE
jgi:hypothetical protein